MNQFSIIECPRDAMQGIKAFVPTETKIHYLNALLEAGFHTLDFGSFVSPKAVPQMRDTSEIIPHLNKRGTLLLAIIVNKRGAEDASRFEIIDQLGYPLSVSETFQNRNSRKTIAESLKDLKEIKTIADHAGKEMVIYTSMGFGNPYGEPYSIDLLKRYIDTLATMGFSIISVSDTVGKADQEWVYEVLSAVQEEFSELDIGAHLHSVRSEVAGKVKAVERAGIKRLDGALGGYGGCPFAEDELVGNLDTQLIIKTLVELGYEIPVTDEKLQDALSYYGTIFN